MSLVVRALNRLRPKQRACGRCRFTRASDRVTRWKGRRAISRGDRPLHGDKVKPWPCVHSFSCVEKCTEKRPLSTRTGTGRSCCLGKPCAVQRQPHLVLRPVANMTLSNSTTPGRSVSYTVDGKGAPCGTKKYNYRKIPAQDIPPCSCSSLEGQKVGASTRRNTNQPG